MYQLTGYKYVSMHFYVYDSVILFWSFESNNRMIDGNGTRVTRFPRDNFMASQNKNELETHKHTLVHSQHTNSLT